MEPFVQEQDASILRLNSWEKEARGLVAGFTTRIGGESESPYEALNCGLHVGDQAEKVVNNRKYICEKVDFPFQSWTCADQIHGNQVEIVTKRHIGSGNNSLEECIENTDGLITAEKNVLLTAFYADCVPLFYFAANEQVIGVAHAGWKGTVANISQNMLQKFATEYHIELNTVKAAIGPSIGKCCYEVGEQVIEQFRSLFNDEKLPEWIEQTKSGKYQLDLKAANRHLLIQGGVPPENIVVSQWCTSCHTDLFFSHRKEAGKTGRMTAFIGWKES